MIAVLVKDYSPLRMYTWISLPPYLLEIQTVTRQNLIALICTL